MTSHRLTLGRQGEELATAFLLTLGYQIIQRNFATRVGEIDIVAADGDTLVFVEVRTRSRDDGISPLDSVTNEKRKQVRRVVSSFLAGAHYSHEQDLRIDVIGVIFSNDGATIEHLKDAF